MDRFAGFEQRIAALVAGESVFEFAVIEHFWCAPYVEQLRPCSRRVILDLHNIESQWHREPGRAAKGPARSWASEAIRGSVGGSGTQMAADNSTPLLVTSGEDAEVVRGLSHACPIDLSKCAS